MTKKTTTKPSAAKKPAARDSSAKKPAAKTSASKKPAVKPSPVKKPAAKSAPAKKPAAKPAPVKKPAVKPAPAKKPAAKPAPVKKPAAGFNLIEELWIPIAGTGLVSLRQVFTNAKFRSLGGAGVSKIALLKFLLALCQAAHTPKDTDEWLALGAAGLAKKVLEYLEKRHNDFYLYGKKPFLQIPAVAAAARRPFGAVLPDVAAGNTTILTQSQQERALSDAEKAVLVVQLMGFALGGKSTDNSVRLSPEYQGKYSKNGKPATGKPGASIGFLGYLHHFLTGANLLETLWLNVLTLEDIKRMKFFSSGLGPIPWETPPKSEDDSNAEKLKYSLMGRLVPFSRFILLAGDGLHCSEGILHASHQDSMTDPSVAMNGSGKKIKVLWTDPSKRPWRNLTSLLGFLLTGEQYFDCPYIHIGMNRINTAKTLKKLSVIGIWSAGLRVSSNAGEQYVSGIDDYVESETFFNASDLRESLYINLKSEMNILDKLSNVLYGRVMGYYKELKSGGEPFAKQAAEHYWQLCERKFQDLVNACSGKPGKTTKDLRPYFLRCVQNSYAVFCPRETARQLNSWAKNYPRLGKFAAAAE